jgi:fucose permease
MNKADMPTHLFYFTNLAWCVISLTALLTGFGFGGGNSSDTQFQSTVENDDGIASLKIGILSRAV